jgi:drug/metabolite transporter (DMT)-like permease
MEQAASQQRISGIAVNSDSLRLIGRIAFALLGPLGISVAFAFVKGWLPSPSDPYDTAANLGLLMVATGTGFVVLVKGVRHHRFAIAMVYIPAMLAILIFGGVAMSVYLFGEGP